MDWIEEQVDKIKKYIYNASLFKSFLGYSILALVGALTLHLFTKNICLGWINIIAVEDNSILAYYTLDEIISCDLTFPQKILLIIYNYNLLIYLIGAFVFIDYVVIKTKINSGLNAICKGINAITLGDLNHEIDYYSKDEIGELCNDFERMRTRLIRDKRLQWENQEEQRKINQAFAHDVRTPLTIVLGYTDFLLKYIPKDKVSKAMLVERLNMMKSQEERLIEYTKTMSSIQKVENREIKCKWISIHDLLSRIKASAQIFEKNYNFNIIIINDNRKKMIYVDTDIVMEVFENVINNAIRYARKNIEIQINVEKTLLRLYIKDDGDGFTDKALRAADQFYYSEDKAQGMHYGLGLSICKMLCEHHGGNIALSNSIECGAIVAASFEILKK